MANGNGQGADLNFTADLFKAADKLRGNLEPSEYKHVALGLIFLKYISDAFDAQHAKLAAQQHADPEDPEEYLAENVFWVPKEARWSYLQANANTRSPTATRPALTKRPPLRFWSRNSRPCGRSSMATATPSGSPVRRTSG